MEAEAGAGADAIRPSQHRAGRRKLARAPGPDSLNGPPDSPEAASGAGLGISHESLAGLGKDAYTCANLRPPEHT